MNLTKKKEAVNLKKGKYVYLNKLQCEYLDHLLNNEYKNCTDPIYLEMILKIRKKLM